jgi:adenylosuccinate synthase
MAPSAVIVLGSQWGDEGKGKLVDYFSTFAQVCARFNGGTNAGHTLVLNGVKVATHLLPSGIFNSDCVNVVGNGCVVHLQSLFSELEEINKNEALPTLGHERLRVSDRAHIVFNFHQLLDGLNEAAKQSSSSKALGTTKQGIGPTYAHKAHRCGLRVVDLIDGDFDKDFVPKFLALLRTVQSRFPLLSIVSEQVGDKRSRTEGQVVYDADAELRELRVLAERVRPFVCDTSLLVHDAIVAGKKVLIEGANAAMLDIDHGTYPYVTSSSPTSGGVCTGLGIPPSMVGSVVGVVKAYTTRVGAGPFPSELSPDVPSSPGEIMQRVGREFGTTTGRVRRCGWFDAVVVKYTSRVNGFTNINLTKLDVLSGIPKLRVAYKYIIDGKELPAGGFPASLDALERAEVQYKEVDGWTEDLAKCRVFDDLPKAAQQYVLLLEELCGVPITYIGVGPDRNDQVIRGRDVGRFE